MGAIPLKSILGETDQAQTLPRKSDAIGNFIADMARSDKVKVSGTVFGSKTMDSALGQHKTRQNGS
jgi:hypothetical protein